MNYNIDNSIMDKINELENKIDKLKEENKKDETKKYIIFIDLANSTKYKYLCKEEVHKWSGRQKLFLLLVEATVNKFFKQAYYKFLGDAVFVSIDDDEAQSKHIIDFIEVLHNIIIRSTEKKYGIDAFQYHIAIDYGKVIVLSDSNQDPIGTCVDRCSRIASIAGDNQILLSADALVNLRSNIHKNVTILSFHDIHVKGIPDAIEIHEIRFDNENKHFNMRISLPDCFRRKVKIIKDNYAIDEWRVSSKTYEDMNNTPAKVAVFAPHADDIELGCGSTVAKLLDKYNVQLFYYVLTCGKMILSGKEDTSQAVRLPDVKKVFSYLISGEPDNKMDIIQSDINKTIYNSSYNGISHWLTVFHSYPDGKMDSSDKTNEMRNHLRALTTSGGELSDVDMVFVPSLHDVHQDHKMLANVAIEILRKQENVFFYETPDSGKHPAEPFNPNFYVEVSDEIPETSRYRKLEPKVLDYIKSKVKYKDTMKHISYADLKVWLLNQYQTENEKYWNNVFAFYSTMRVNAVKAYMTTAEDKDKFAESFEVTLRL